VLLSDPNDVRALHMKGQMLHVLEPMQAIELIEKAGVIMKENAAKQHSTPSAEQASNKILSITMQLVTCEAMQSLDKYSQAFDIYEALEREVSTLNDAAHQERLLHSIFVGESGCLFQMEEFQRAKHVAECALRLDRRQPAVHILIALAQWALEEKKDAVRTMCRGVLYEAPWDTENQLKNRKCLQGFIDSMNDEEH
jgi:tetratricopeptide (TPR) repeat protein